MIVKYKVKVAMEDLSSHFWPLSAKRIVMIHQPPLTIHYNLHHEWKHDVKALLFMSQGSSRLSIILDKDAYQPSEELRVQCTVNNESCDKKVERIVVKLRREATCYSEKGAHLKDKITVAKKIYSGVPARTTTSFFATIDLRQAIIEQHFIDALFKQGVRISEEGKALTQSLVPSIKATLVQCEYLLEIRLDHGLLAVGSRMPPARIPIFIYPASLPRNCQQLPQQIIPNPFIASDYNLYHP